MNVPGGGKNDIPNRLKRQFAIFNVPQPSGAAINAIFGALVQARTPACVRNPDPNPVLCMWHDWLEACCPGLQGRFSAETCSAEVVAVAGRLVAATQALWARVAPKMLPTPAKFHYLFNMRDISKVGQNY
jgi:dynein heavy chain